MLGVPGRCPYHGPSVTLSPLEEHAAANTPDRFLVWGAGEVTDWEQQLAPHQCRLADKHSAFSPTGCSPSTSLFCSVSQRHALQMSHQPFHTTSARTLGSNRTWETEKCLPLEEAQACSWPTIQDSVPHTQHSNPLIFWIKLRLLKTRGGGGGSCCSVVVSLSSLLSWFHILHQHRWHQGRPFS